MKKNSMERLVKFIDEQNVTELFDIKDELTATLARGEVKANANRAEYAEYHDKVMELLEREGKPLTAQEIAVETGIARGKIVHGLNDLWDEEIVKDATGKSTTYAILA